MRYLVILALIFILPKAYGFNAFYGSCIVAGTLVAVHVSERAALNRKCKKLRKEAQREKDFRKAWEEQSPELYKDIKGRDRR